MTEKRIWLGPWIFRNHTWHRDFLHRGVKVRKIRSAKFHGYIRLEEKI